MKDSIGNIPEDTLATHVIVIEMGDMIQDGVDNKCNDRVIDILRRCEIKRLSFFR